MKAAFRISVFANFLLVGLLLWLAPEPLLTHQRPPYDPLRAAALGESTGERAKFQQAPKTSPQDGFHWNQVESSDYPTYISNLRRIGCPEETVRDIITADVDSVYALKRAQIQRNELTGNLRDLREEETSVLSALLGSASSPLPSVQPRRNRSIDTPPTIPLVFQNLSSNEANLTEQQVQVITDLRQRFEDALGGQKQDPQDPAYRQRWEAAQRENDDLLQAMLGGEFFLEHQLQASRQHPSP